MSKIDIVNLIEEYGIPTQWEDLVATYRINANKEQVDSFQKEFDRINEEAHFYSDYVELIKKYRGIFNPEIYALRIGRLLLEDINNGIEENKYQEQSQRVFKAKHSVSRDTLVKKLKNMLKKVDVIDYWFDGVENNNHRLVLFTSKQFCGDSNHLARLREEKEPKLAKIDETIGLNNVVSNMIPQDLVKVFTYDNIAHVTIQILMNNIRTMQERAYNGDVEIPGFTLEQVRQFIDSGRVLYNTNDIVTVLKSNAGLVDFDRLLALSCALKYNAHGNNFSEFTEQESTALLEYCNQVEGLLDKKNPPVEGETIIKTDFKTIRNSIYVLNRHFVGGEFRSNEELEQLYRDIIEGRKDVTELSKADYRDRLQISSVMVPEIVSHNPKAFVFLAENGYIDEQDVKSITLLMDSYTDDQINYLVNNGILSSSEVLLLYSQGKASLENVDSVAKLSDEARSGIVDSISSAELISLYMNPERKDEYSRYKNLYKKYKVDGQSEEIREEVSQELLSQSNDLLEDTTIYDLYHQRLITLQTAIGFIGADAVIKTFAEGALKPEDCRKLYEEGILNEEVMASVLRDPKFDDGKKLVLIYSTFSDLEEDKDVRERMLNYLSDPEAEYRETSKGKTQGRNSSDHSQLKDIKNKYVTDPVVRFGLISQIDKEYTVSYLPDGHVIFYMPNKGQYFVEKCFDKNKKFSYGKATYIFDEALFEQHKDELIVDQMVNRTKMRRLYMQDKEHAKKIIHTGWGKAICRHFHVEDQEVYTAEERKKIEELAELVEQAKEVYER